MLNPRILCKGKKACSLNHPRKMSSTWDIPTGIHAQWRNTARNFMQRLTCTHLPLGCHHSTGLEGLKWSLLASCRQHWLTAPRPVMTKK